MKNINFCGIIDDGDRWGLPIGGRADDLVNAVLEGIKVKRSIIE